MDLINAAQEELSKMEISTIWNWIINFYPLDFFGFKIPIIFLVTGILILTAIIKATVKTLIKIVLVVAVLYIISRTGII